MMGRKLTFLSLILCTTIVMAQGVGSLNAQPPYPHTIIFRLHLPEFGGLADAVTDVQWYLKDASDSYETTGCLLSKYFYNDEAGLVVVNLTDAAAFCPTPFKYEVGDSLLLSLTAEKAGKLPVRLTVGARVQGRGVQWLGEVSSFVLEKRSGEEATSIPKEFRLHQNYPNPFNPETTITYDLPEAALVVLEIYNLHGQRVRTLLREHRKAGSHRALWDGRDDSGQGVASGIYAYKLKAGDFAAVKKMVFLK